VKPLSCKVSRTDGHWIPRDEMLFLVLQIIGEINLMSWLCVWGTQMQILPTEVSRGTDITELFECSHPNPNVDKVLAKYFV
jgi:hypothetical protein